MLSRIPRAIDVALLGLGVAALGLLCLELLRSGSLTFFDSRTDIVLTFAVAATFLATCFVGGRSRMRVVRGLGRIGLLAAATPLTLLAASRLPRMIAKQQWPPPLRTFDSGVTWLKPAEALRWTTMLLAHASTARRQELADGAMANDWPVPGGVQFALARSGDTIRISTVDSLQSLTCSATLVDGALVGHEIGHDAVSCVARRTAAITPVRTHITRTALGSLPTAAAVDTSQQWTQYRRDARHSAAISDTAGGRSWRTHLGASIRSSPSGARGVVAAGTHGTGTLAILELGTGRIRWRTALPNWVHQDPVSNGDVLAVGFGDNSGSEYGRAPAGVSVYRVADGRLSWTAFETNSVMTSPIILDDSTLFYATMGRIARIRDLRTGALRRSVQIIGLPTMAPPAADGGSIVMALDDDFICVFRASDLQEKWCKRFSGLHMLGHSAPAIFGDTIVFSGMTTLRLRSMLSQLSSAPLSHSASFLRQLLLARTPNAFGQRLMAVSLDSGAVLWSGPTLSARAFQSGHISGTPVEVDGIGVAVLPIPNLVVAFRMMSGDTIWTADADGSRGGALVVGRRVIQHGRMGHVRVLDVGTGAELCKLPSKDRFDRSGAAVVGATIVAGTVAGEVVAAPLAELLNCKDSSLRQP